MIGVLGLLALFASAIVLLIQMRRGKFFTLLTFYSILFMLENAGAAVKALLPGIFPDFASLTSENPLPWVPRALTLSLIGYLLFLYGYVIVTFLARGSGERKDALAERWFNRWWTPGFKFFLAIITAFAIAVGFIQHWARIRAAGGIVVFLATAYTHRFGTATEGTADTIVVVLANLVAGSAVPLVLLWMFAWLRGRLNGFDKLIVSGFILILMLRQWSTMFRAVLFFTVLSFVAAYISERRLKMTKLVLIGAAIFGVLVGVNFVHLYLYYLTAGWSRQGLVESMAQFLAPHGHIYSLSHVVAKLHGGAPGLGGTGFLESMFFFVPRVIWQTKLESNLSGTLLVQAWADLPTHYQMAVTAVGEWMAHFGYAGIAAMALFGALYAAFDSFADRGPVARAALFGVLLSRVLADAGMGLSAIFISIFCLLIFLGELVAAQSATWCFRRLISVPRALIRRAQPRSAARRPMTVTTLEPRV